MAMALPVLPDTRESMQEGRLKWKDIHTEQLQLIYLTFSNVTKPYDHVKILLASQGSWGYSFISFIPDPTQKEGWGIWRKYRPVIGFKIVTPLPLSRVILENSAVGIHIDLALNISLNTESSKAIGNKFAFIFYVTRHITWKVKGNKCVRDGKVS